MVSMVVTLRVVMRARVKVRMTERVGATVWKRVRVKVRVRVCECAHVRVCVRVRVKVERSEAEDVQ